MGKGANHSYLCVARSVDPVGLFYVVRGGLRVQRISTARAAAGAKTGFGCLGTGRTNRLHPGRWRGPPLWRWHGAVLSFRGPARDHVYYTMLCYIVYTFFYICEYMNGRRRNVSRECEPGLAEFGTGLWLPEVVLWFCLIVDFLFSK